MIYVSKPTQTFHYNRFSLFIKFLSRAIHYSDCYGPKMASKAHRVILRINSIAIKEKWHHKLAQCYNGTQYGISKPGSTIRLPNSVISGLEPGASPSNPASDTETGAKGGQP